MDITRSPQKWFNKWWQTQTSCFYMILTNFWVRGTTAKFGFSTAKFRFSTAKFRISTRGPRWDHAPYSCVFVSFGCAPNVSNLSQAVWPKVVLTISITPVHRVWTQPFFVNCHNKMHLLAEPPCVSKTWQQQWVAGAQRQWSNVVSFNNHGISWQPFRTTIGFDIMSSIPSEGPLNSNIYVLNGWITATSAPGGGKVRSVTAKFTLTLRSILCPYLDSQGIYISSWQWCFF